MSEMTVAFMPERDVDLQPLNTLGVPVRAQFYCAVTNIQELRQALAWARSQHLPLLILGGGSNMVLPAVVDGLCIHLQLSGIEYRVVDEEWVNVTAAAGENWHAFVQDTLDHQAYGLENLALIPGTVGAAPIQNIGAYGVEVKDFLETVTAINRETGELVGFTNGQCLFDYRDSTFKTVLLDQYVIVSVTFRLRRTPAINIAYQALQDVLAQVAEPAPQDVFNAVVSIRSSKLPDPDRIANVGSFFKNPRVSAAQYQQLVTRYPNIVAYPEGEYKKLAAGWLIDQAGWKGYCNQKVGVHKEQALVLVNPTGSASTEILALAEQIQQDIRKKYGVSLEIEPRVY